jgi:hypothetical protein
VFDCSLLVYRKATDFYKLVLYSATTLLKLLMVSRSFLVEFFRSLKYQIMSSMNKDSLTSSLPVCIPFTSFYSLIALARNSRTMLNKSGESGHPCLIPDCRENGFSFSPLNMMLAIGLSYTAFITLSITFLVCGASPDNTLSSCAPENTFYCLTVSVLYTSNKLC